MLHSTFPSAKVVVITSTDEDHVSYGTYSGNALFSGEFFKALAAKKSYGGAWEQADAKVCDDMRGLPNIKSKDVMNLELLRNNRTKEFTFPIK